MNENIKKIKSILKGEIGEIEDELKKEMLEHAENLNFEKAQKIKEKAEKCEKGNTIKYIPQHRNMPPRQTLFKKKKENMAKKHTLACNL